jgi:glyoxylase-like metal-dependent hydrolase (beta-lactamase superfamily II)
MNGGPHLVQYSRLRRTEMVAAAVHELGIITLQSIYNKQNFAAFPRQGEVIEVAEGMLWTRFALPFALNHVNVFLVEDQGGWAAIDTGLGDEATKETWLSLLAGPLGGARLTRIVVTHHHPDHMGVAGWLAEKFAIPVYMTETEYLFAQHLVTNTQVIDEQGYRRFYRQHGVDDLYSDAIISQGHHYKRLVTRLPWSYRQLLAGDPLLIGGRRFDIFTGGGHSPDQAMLFCREDGIFFAADQVLPHISPNISVHAINPEGNPLGQYLHSLAAIKAELPDGVLVMSGHHLPFRPLHERIDQLIGHHEARCALIEEACKLSPRTAAEIMPVLFRRPLDPHQTSFAFGETLAHMNLMARQGRLVWIPDGPVDRASVP